VQDPEAAQLVRLRFFAGLSIREADEMLGLSRSSAYERWAFARAWLHSQITGRDTALFGIIDS
jgi:DNA invertase Pin-like site-specific DNA recombinase